MSGFAGNVLRLGSGHALAQLINVATIPLVTRIYSPVDFGYYSAYLGAAIILAPVVSLRLANFVVLPEDDRDASALVLLSQMFVLVFVAAVLPLAVWLALQLAPGLADAELRRYLVWLPLAVICIAAADAVSSWNLRGKQFGTMSLARIIEVTIDRSVGVSLGVAGGIGAFGLIAGRIVGPLIGMAYSLRRGVAGALIRHWRALSRADLRRVFADFRANALYASGATLASAGAREFPAVLIASYYGGAAAGYYGLCLRILNLPLMTVGDVIARVHYQRMAEIARAGGDFVPQLLTVLKYMFYIIFPATLVILFTGEELFALAFGAEWSEAGRYAQILVLGFVFTFLHRVPSVLFDTLMLNKARVGFEALLLVVRLGVIVIMAALASDVPTMLVALLVVTIAVILASTFYLFGRVRVGVGRWVGLMLGLAARFYPMWLGLPVARMALPPHHSQYVLLAIVPLLGLQAAALLAHDAELRQRALKFYASRRG